MKTDSLTIGEVARLAGVNRETLRYYERRGLVAPYARTDGGYRLYGSSTPKVIRFIKRAQELGFSLQEIEGLISLRDNSGRSCKEVRSVAQTHLDEIDEKLRKLRAVKRRLTKLVTTCSAQRVAPNCPILDALDEGGLDAD